VQKHSVSNLNTMLLTICCTHPTKHTIDHIGDGFYGSNDPTDSVKALKEVVS